MRVLTIGLSGGTCSGKTSVASLLGKALPWCQVVNQDKYYHEEDSGSHVRNKPTNLINWEVLEAFNMEKMKLDIEQIRQNAFNHKTLPTQQKNTIKGISRWKDTKLKPIPILIVEGIIIFHDPDIEKMCDKKYFIEIEHDVCKSRRESRVWDPEGSCWEESPAYFEGVAWPEYLRTRDHADQLPGVTFLEANNTDIETNFHKILGDIVETLRE